MFVVCQAMDSSFLFNFKSMKRNVLVLGSVDIKVNVDVLKILMENVGVMLLNIVTNLISQQILILVLAKIHLKGITFC